MESSPLGGVSLGENGVARALLLNIIAACIYAAFLRLDVFVPSWRAQVTAIGLAPGLGLGLMLISGSRIWPGIGAGAFLGAWTAGYRGDAAVVAALGHTTEALVAAYLARRITTVDELFATIRPLGLYLAFPAALATLIAPGATAIAWLMGERGVSLFQWLGWWIGGAVSCLIITPLITVWSRYPHLSQPHPGLAPIPQPTPRIPETLSLLALTFFVSVVAFDLGYPLAYSTMPFLVWSAYRFRQHGGTAALAIISCAAYWATAHGYGQFTGPGLNTHQSFLLVQLFVAAGAVTTLVLAAVVTERQRAQQGLSALGDRYRALVEDAPCGIYQLDPHGHYLSANPVLARILGYQSTQALMDDRAGPLTDSAQGRHEFFHLVNTRGSIVNHESQILRQDGAAVWISESARAVRSPTGDVLYVEGLVEDTTARKRAEAARQQLLGRLVTAQDEERSRIARELHDALGGQLTALNLGLAWVSDRSHEDASLHDYVLRLRDEVTTLMGEVHHLAWDLWPAALDLCGIGPALQQYAAQVSERHGIRVQYHSSGADTDGLPRGVETTLYRVVQEALTNVSKHASAQNVSILLQRQDRQITAIVEDDGVGFDPETIHNRHSLHSGLGLIGMRERLAVVNGELTLESSPGCGATIYVRIPLDNATSIQEKSASESVSCREPSQELRPALLTRGNP